MLNAPTNVRFSRRTFLLTGAAAGEGIAAQFHQVTRSVGVRLKLRPTWHSISSEPQRGITPLGYGRCDQSRQLTSSRPDAASLTHGPMQPNAGISADCGTYRSESLHSAECH